MTDIAKGLSNDLAEIVERRGSSVVRVESSRMPGSGIVWSADGVIVAASHSIEGEEGIEVGLADRGNVPATLVGRDPTTDVAVLRVSTAGLSVPVWTDPAGVKVGNLVLGLSRPGRSVRASLGIVSVRGEAWRTPSGGLLDQYLQTDLARHPGLSGSLLCGVTGEGIGLNTAGLLRGATLAISGPTLRRVVEALLAHGAVRRGFLGIGTYPVRLPAPLEKEAGQPGALMLVSIEPASPAEKAGLRLGDAILSFAGQTLKHPSDLLGLLDADRIGTEVAVRLLRSGELRDLALTVGTRNG
jgi:S1-C subfamily serine protease